jgi:hypothetical protein
MNVALVRSELTRLLFRRRLLLVLALLLALAIHDMAGARTSPGVPGLYGVLAYWRGDGVYYPILAGVVSAGALASDLEEGYTGLVLSRRIDRRQYLLSKAAAMFLAAALVAVLYHLFLVAAAAVLLPWQDALMYADQQVLYLRKGYVIETLPGPVPELYVTHPILNDLILVTMLAIGAGALATMGLIPASLGGSVYLCMGFPLLWYLIMLYLSGEGFTALSPYHYLDVYYTFRLPPRAQRVASWLLYWVGTVGVSVTFALFVAEKRELGSRGRT